jgi:GNAT superfamily N-acetyltransferase
MKKTSNIIEFEYEYIPFAVRESITQMEASLALMFSAKSKDCGVGLRVTIPTEKDLFDNKQIKYVIYKINKKIVAYLSYYVVEENNSGMDRGIVYLHNIYVDKLYRNKGIAKQLLKYVMDKHPDKYYQATIMAVNEGSLNLLKSVGLISKIPLYSTYVFHTDYNSVLY